jgi:hypothetical protein
MNETEPLPQDPAETPATEPTSADRPRRAFLRPVIIGVASGLAVLGLGIGGAVIADMVDLDDTVTVSSRDDSNTPAPSPISSSNIPTPTASPMPIDDDSPISDADYAAVSAAAIAAAGGSGTIEELKREDDGTVAWEIDVRVSNGAKIEVELASDLSVVSTRVDD